MVTEVLQCFGCYDTLINGQVETNLYIKPTVHHYSVDHCFWIEFALKKACDDRNFFKNTCYLIFEDIGNVQGELHVSFVPDGKHEKVLIDFLRTGFQTGQCLKDQLIMPVIPKV